MSMNRSASSGTGGEIDRDETFNLIASDKVEGTDVRRPMATRSAPSTG